MEVFSRYVLSPVWQTTTAGFRHFILVSIWAWILLDRRSRCQRHLFHWSYDEQELLLPTTTTTTTKINLKKKVDTFALDVLFRDECMFPSVESEPSLTRRRLRSCVGMWCLDLASGKVKEKKGSPHFGDHSLTLALVDDGCALSAFRASLMSSYCWTKVTRPVACIQNGEFSIWLLWRRRRRKKITIGLLGALFTVASWYPQTSVRYPVSPSRLEICCATLPRTVSPP